MKWLALLSQAFDATEAEWRDSFDPTSFCCIPNLDSHTCPAFLVCNTSFTDLSDSRVKTEIAEADVAELQQLFDSVEAKQYKRPDMNRT